MATAPGPANPLTRYPDGWFAIARSDDVEPGAVEPVTFMGNEVVLVRSESGEARVFDAYCVHLGAHLGYGGTLEGDALVCPFHAWKFGPDGRCVDVPYSDKVPPRAGLRAWPVVERNGVILVWHHHDGKDPFYEIPDFQSDEWTETKWQDLLIEMHIFDIAENGVDSAHFPHIHRCSRSGTELVDGMGIPFHFDLFTSYPGDGIGIVGEHVKVTTTWKWYGVGMFEGVSIADDFGMRVRQLFHFTPTDDGKVLFRIGIGVDKNTVPEELREFVIDANAKIACDNLLEDAPIWKHKKFNPQPQLTEADGPLGPLRIWLRQFFPDLGEATKMA